jgi:hypothetical protein
MLSVYNVLGQEVMRLVDEHRDAGYYSVDWNATAAASGLYYARMIVKDELGANVYMETKKILLMK